MYHDELPLSVLVSLRDGEEVRKREGERGERERGRERREREGGRGREGDG